MTYLPAPGHTKGNCIVAVETDGLFYLLHGGVTYTDVALYENRLSVVYEDLAADWRCPRCKQPKEKFSRA